MEVSGVLRIPTRPLSPACPHIVWPSWAISSVDTAEEHGAQASGREASDISPSQVASMNQRRVDFYLASVEDMLVAVGGRNENGALSSVETYSPKTNSWTYVAGLPR